LAGSQGILVNITAGMDMSIGEFEEVGNTVKEFASDNATVVVGTVIDPEMRGDMRVTVVATGLRDNKASLTSGEERSVKLVQKVSNSDLNYGDLDKPTVMRNKNASAGEGLANSEDNMDYLDIPAFLRRQAD
ncbi:MAG: cell division protein FtsZ, partial [Gammaproteobacteria bacterium]|nr:cell division protein FtsZ [Gammaproteobacteria bacterium]